MKFVPFIENNDHEGETWRFWLQQDHNEYQLEVLQGILGDNEEFSLDITGAVDESIVDTLIEYSQEGYMPLENKVTGKFKAPKLAEGEFPSDHFYKGNIERFFEEEK
jgi:hypothetical protein